MATNANDPDRELLELRAALAEAVGRAERAEAALAAPDARGPMIAAAAEELRWSERLMRAVFTSASDAIFLIDDEGHYVDVNPAACTLLGRSRSKLLLSQLGGFAEAPEVTLAAAFRKLRETGEVHGRDAILRPSGERRIVDYAGMGSIGARLHLLLLRDVTAETMTAASLTWTEAELRRIDARFRLLVEKSAEVTALLMQDGELRYITPHSRVVLGFPPEQLVGLCAIDFMHPEDQGAARDAIAAAVQDGSATANVRMFHRDGSERWFEAILTNLLDDPEISALVVNLRDVTGLRASARERERLIESLTFERSRLGSLLEKAPAFMAVLRGEQHVFELANEAYYAMVGQRDLIGRPIAAAIPEFVTQGFVAQLDHVLATGETYVRRAIPAVLSSGPGGAIQRRTVNVVLQALTEADGTRSGVFIHGVDVTAEAVAKQRSDALFNGVPVPTYAWQRVVVDGEPDFLLLEYNYAASKISTDGIEAFRGRSAREMFVADHDVLGDLERCITGGETFQRELKRPMKTHTAFRRFVITYAPAPPDVVLAHAEDVTERRKLEEQLRQGQKMEAIGRLAGGVAHDFNNILSVVLSYAAMVLEDLPAAHPARPDLKEIEEAAQRAVGLTKQLLAFSRQQVLQPRTMSVGQTVTELERMLRRLLGEDVELVLRAPVRASIDADRGQIEQVIMNLVINARDAMPEGGRLIVEANEVDVPTAVPSEPAFTPPGAYVMLAVSDTGVGMDEATQARVFEPFFTTKGPGKGTGLGLATVFGIVQQSGGNILIESSPGRGSTFRIYFPRAAAAEPGARSTPPRGVVAVRGTETILIVEDEAKLRTLLVSVLRRSGYDVLEAGDGEAAAALAGETDRPIHLLITDVVMPRMNGRQLADQLCESRPDLKTLFMSGYTDDAAVLQRILVSKAAFLQKPITPDALLARIRQVLAAAP